MTTAELRRLLAEATPGKLRPDGWHVYVGAGMRKRDVAQTFTEQDARLIAAAVNVLPAHLDVVEAAQRWVSADEQTHKRTAAEFFEQVEREYKTLRAALAKLEEET